MKDGWVGEWLMTSEVLDLLNYSTYFALKTCIINPLLGNTNEAVEKVEEREGGDRLGNHYYP